jgi:hypothetical protein
MTPKSPDVSLPSPPRIACYGTAFLADDPIYATALNRGIAPDVSQFSSPRLDASFLANCGSYLNGRTATMDDPRAYFKRVAGTEFRSPKATVFFECSTELCGLLAALTEVRAAEIAQEWYGASGLPKTKPREPNGRTQRRLAILNGLAALARQAKVGNKMLMLRVEYRKQR